MTRVQSRKDRGRKTERLIAERWQQNGFAPDCYKVGAGESGNDIVRVPGLRVEVKARDTVSFPKALRQARLNMLRDNATDTTDPETAAHERYGDSDFHYPWCELPIVIARHNGQGEKSVDEFTVTMTLLDFENLWRRANAGSAA